MPRKAAGNAAEAFAETTSGHAQMPLRPTPPLQQLRRFDRRLRQPPPYLGCGVVSGDVCTKCGGEMTGPRYGKNDLGWERLFYTCTTCGYRAEGPTNDARKRADMPPWFPGQEHKDER